jgi:hypothetical protein
MATAVIVEKQKQITKRVESSNYSISKIIYKRPHVSIDEVLPFRVKFTTIGIEASRNFPGIGLQVIGVSNYIL